ncbi:MAG: ribosome biogenesis GTP-binding protein YihA/YsxC [Hallerella porci]|uniref:Probable GTP-binding protein EngB n=1 Tax=Hallerella porci TaxID=1945871 RepID=A0ABX5LKR4_9BACT|nr:MULTISPECIES: ribosome biogenesis GTP-binding protein YihA/YsxC [Hallerella]MCI5600262.1 ribosome biogenesis GTP-binding protein YihA/YsxC [Hallerella sp.]MDY3921240.1 ribosome biogenesis GTP-binding protein YihA/YsxC [Hallerella porci]PWK94769.1 GTP-binding protein [Hallerella porci]
MNETMMNITAEFTTAATKLSQIPDDGLPQVAFLGRSNAGKSSLLNALSGKKKLVRISSKPGKTREINFFKINQAFYLVDLPGVGFAGVDFNKMSEMENGIRAYVEKSKNLRGIIYLIDSKVGLQPIDVETIENVRAAGCPILPVMSKCDKANQSEQAKTRNAIQKILGNDVKPLRLSVLKKVGMEEIWQEILSTVAVEAK